MYVRWLGFQRGYFTPQEVVRFELSRTTEAAAEFIPSTAKGSLIGGKEFSGCWWGLLCDKKFVARQFPHDAWSKKPDAEGKLRRGKSGTKYGYANPTHTHTEAWVKPGGYIGLVICWKGGFGALSADKRWFIQRASREYNLPVYQLAGTRLKEIQV